jgi:predicted choloylglycine hydrolase
VTDPVALTFRAVAEPWPGERWRERFEATWPAFRRWYLSDGDAARPTYALARRMLAEHMPELVPAWEAMVALTDGSDVAARMLTLYSPPPLLRGCSQAVFADPDPVLVRNYDYDPGLFEGVIAATGLQRRVIGMSDCLWGLLDGINDAGLTVALAFGGRPQVGEGFGVPLVVRYLLEVCETTGEALEVLARLPVQVSYNMTIADRHGAAATSCIAPDRTPVLRAGTAATNHPPQVEWPAHAAATRSVERERRLHELLASADGDVVGAFLEPPLYTRDYAGGFGTLYTAAYRPADGAVEYRWPSAGWRQSLDAFEEGARTVVLAAAER